MTNNSNSFLIDNRLKFLQDRKSNLNVRWNITWFLGNFLSEFVSISKPKSILEVGTSNGFSTLWIAKGASDAKIYTIEVNEDRFNEAKNNFEMCKLDNIIGLNGDVFEILNDYDFGGLKFDFIFLDAAHQRYKDVILMLEEKDLLDLNVKFVCDNVLSHKYMNEFIDFMKNKFENCELIEADSGLLVASTFKK